MTNSGAWRHLGKAQSSHALGSGVWREFDAPDAAALFNLLQKFLVGG